MGGNALKNCVTRRFDADEYYELENEVFNMLDKNVFFYCRMAVVRAYALKESFGDMDIIIESDAAPSNWIELIENTFQPKEVFKNGNVFSFEYKQCQIDLILTKSEDFDSSSYYFDYNDMGNLIGRVAHKLGLKLGHDGLSYVWRVDTHAFRTLTLLKDWKDILPVLGYSYERYAEGFDTLEDIFEFVVSSRFFNKAIYELDNRNHTSRVRDRKRKTYMEFLKWLESYEETEAQRVMKELQGDGKEFWLPTLFCTIPNFKEQYYETQKDYEAAIEYKRRFNGDLVKQWTGLEGKELGEFMRWFKQYYGEDKIKREILNINEELIERWTTYFVEKWKNEA